MERQTHNLLVAGSNPAGPTLFVFVFVGSKNGVVLGFGWLVGCCWFSSLGFLFLVCSLGGRGLGSGVVGPSRCRRVLLGRPCKSSGFLFGRATSRQSSGSCRFCILGLSMLHE